MSGRKVNPEYERMKANAPRILAEMVQMLLRWQKMGFHVPRGVKNIFEFTWEELMTTPPRKSFSGLYCPVIHFVSFDEEPLAFTAVSAPTPSKVQKTALAGQDTKHTYELPSLESQELLQKFQKRSVHLLSELLKIKMKIMIDAVAGPSAAEIKRFLEGGQQLSPKTQEEANEFMTQPKKKGRGTAPIIPAIPITSTTQLVQQLSFSCLCFALSFKDTKGQKDQASSKGSDGTTIEPKLDPCPQAREMLREICRTIEKEKAERIEKGQTRPLILKNYNILHKSPSMALKRYPSGIAATERRLKGKRFLFAVPDGTSFLFYPSGNVAICQFPICCIGKPITLLFQDVPNQKLLGTFIPEGQCCVGYSFKCNCSIALLMNQDGGTIRDKDGYLTHRWTWYSKKQLLRSLEFQVTEHLKLSIRNPQSMTVTFTALNETFTLSLVRPGCTHKTKMEKRVPPQSPEVGDLEVQWHKVLLDIKKRFEKTVRQFINGVLMASGICCIDYPVGPTAKHVKFTFKEAAAETWDRRIKERASELLSEPKLKLKKAGVKAPPSRTPASFKPYKPRLKHPIQHPGAGEIYPPQATWASYSADCPIILRKILAKEEDITYCKCIVKIPLLTDMELEKFLKAPRDPDQVLVICVLSTQSLSYSPYFEWSLEKIYIQMQHGRPSPCVQCKRDPFRFLKYDLDCPLNKKPPLLVQKHGVMPGMVVMYAGGKLLFGGSVFNGYSYSRRDLMKQIDQVRLNYKMGRFLPPSFKFSHIPIAEPPKKPPPPEERTPEPEPKEEPPAVESKEEAVVVVDEPETGKKSKRSSSGKKGKKKSRDTNM